jgi:hypothetical protein
MTNALSAIYSESLAALKDCCNVRTETDPYLQLADLASPRQMPNAVCMTMDASGRRHDEMFAYRVKTSQSGATRDRRAAGRDRRSLSSPPQQRSAATRYSLAISV